MALEGLNIEELCVVNGADRLLSCLDERFPDLETNDKICESLDDAFRLKVDKGGRTAASTGRCRELFEKAARAGIELPDVARGYLMLRGARLGPERKVVVPVAAGQSYTERNAAQALRSTFPINLGVTKEFVRVMDDCDEPLMPLEEQSTSEVDSGEMDALITNFETLSNTTDSTNSGHLEGVSTEPERSPRIPNLRRQHQTLNKFSEGRDASAVVALDTSAKTAQNVSRRNQCPKRKCW